MFRNTFVSRLALLAVAAFAGTAFAQNSRVVESGETTVVLCDSFLNSLKSLGLAYGVVAPTQLNGTTVNFPINGGAIDLQTALGNIGHNGGLTLSAGGTTVALENFTIDTTGSAPVITGIVVANGALSGRITLFDLALPSDFTTPIKLDDAVLTNLRNVSVTLDAAGAAALNSAFHTNALSGGLKVGTARVRAFTNGWIPTM